MMFTDFYAGNAACAPSRAVLLTGKKSSEVSIRGNAGYYGDNIWEGAFLDKDEFTLVNEENWEFDDECRFSEDDDCELYFILDDPKRAAVFKKDRSGFPILLTDLK